MSTPLVRIVALTGLVALAVLPSNLLGSDQDTVREARHRLSSNETQADGITGSGPLCGVYSACVALKLSGIDCTPSQYVSTSFVGSPKGSTPQEISAIARHASADATIISGMSSFDLFWLDAPLVANVRSTPFSKTYDHWVVVAFNGGDVLCFDRTQPPVKMPLAEFLGIWNGLGIVISKPGEPCLPYLWAGRILLLQAIVIVAAMIGRCLPTRPGTRRFVRDATAIVMLAIIFSAVGVLCMGGWSHHRNAVRIASAPFVTNHYRHGVLDELHTAAKTEESLIIDARRNADYRRGTVRGAVNIPVTASLWELRTKFDGVNLDLPMIVFCQSKSCTYSETVADNLSLLGFTNITVCDGGWVEYEKSFLR